MCRYLQHCPSDWLVALQVLSMCHVFPSDSTEVARHYCHRARILQGSGQPLAALQDYLQAAEVGFARVAHCAAHTCSVESVSGLLAVHLQLCSVYHAYTHHLLLKSHVQTTYKHAMCTTCSAEASRAAGSNLACWLRCSSLQLHTLWVTCYELRMQD